MICPHCYTTIHLNYNEEIHFIVEKINYGYGIRYADCPECKKLIIILCKGSIGPTKVDIDDYDNYVRPFIEHVDYEELIYPKYPSPEKLDDSIPEKYLKLYEESEIVNNFSPRASATLSRYLLQMLLNEELGIKKRNLEEEIKELENSNNIPSKLVTLLQVMRKVANFGAHPKKSTNSNEIIEVENGESDVMLELIVELFDHIFVKPNQQQEFLNNVKEKYGIEV